MELSLKLIINCFIAMIALVNPFQKVFVVTSLQKQFDIKATRYISVKATITALIILLTFMFAGQVILNDVFKIQIYAFQVTCGVVLFYNGINGLQKGTFINLDKEMNIKEISAVPIALPMIAGPATITAAVTFPTEYGHIATTIAILLSLGVNLIFMIYSSQIGKIMERFNLLNPLVRIFGLIVATIGGQMVLNGIRGFIG
ncbi:MAG: MarC family protein [Bacteroidales bacterium]|jgi:multiple antibiotic resistance protein|nr:MarC family protein [Bacteroidales bacterium]